MSDFTNPIRRHYMEAIFALCLDAVANEDAAKAIAANYPKLDQEVCHRWAEAYRRLVKQIARRYSDRHLLRLPSLQTASAHTTHQEAGSSAVEGLPESLSSPLPADDIDEAISAFVAGGCRDYATLASRLGDTGPHQGPGTPL